MGRSRNILLSVLIMLTVVGTVSQAEIPTVISYQGKVTDASGNPVANGSYTMRFRIYNVSAGGTALWDSGNRSISVAGGVFSVLLGESPQPALTLDFSADYWLLVTFSGVDQSPRQRMGSTGYAYMASGVVAGTEVSGSVTTGTFAAIKGTNTAATGATYGVFGRSLSTGGSGVYGEAAAASGNTNGVYGSSASTSGSGVFGYATATAGSGQGIYGRSAAASGRGVFGYATSGTGANHGVYGQTLSTAGIGVYGNAAATTGTTYGVYGQSPSTAGTGVYGGASATAGTTYGGYFTTASTSGRGVFGGASATTGNTYGGMFQAYSTSGRGVFGWATAATGATYGAYGQAYSNSGYGVYGWASATTGSTYGVRGRSDSPSGHGVYYSGGLAGTGSKSCVVKTSQGPTLMYCQESPENWFEDFGEGQLVDGRAHIELDPLFVETVSIDPANPMKVFVEVEAYDCNGVAIRRGETGFDIVERHGGTTSSAFWYRVVAKRKGFEAKRLDVCEAARTDSYLYPELREQELQELEAERARHEEERARMSGPAIGHAAMNE